MGHHHDHSHTHDLKGRNLLISIVLNCLITIAQVIGGIISGSLSLLSDALHNFSDVVSLVISYVAFKLSRTKASFHRTFGYKRAEILAAFINASTLVIIAVLLIIEAIERFQNPQEINSMLVIWMAFIAILANGFSVLLLRKDSRDNLNMKSAYLHLFTDMMASVAVLLGGILMWQFRIFWVDSLLTLLIALYLIWVGYDLLKKSSRMLMLFTPEQIDIKEVVRTINAMEGVNRLHHVHVWSLNDDEFHLEAHLELSKNITISQFDLLLLEIEDILDKEFGINHVTIQPEYEKEDPKNIIVQD